MDFYKPRLYPALRLLLVSSDQLLQLRLVTWLATQPDLTLAGCCHSLQASAETVDKAGADLILVDLNVPDGDDIGHWLASDSSFSQHPVILMHEADSGNLPEAGAPAFVSLRYVSEYDRAEVFFANLRSVLDQMQVTHEHPAALDALSVQEQQVLRLVVMGLKNKEIAERLNLSSYTVRNYLSSIYSKLGVANRTEAVSRLRDLEATALTYPALTDPK